jgi:uncharacterized protein (DUF1800 family)
MASQVIDIILAQPVTAEFVATKLYRFFVRDEVSPELRVKLGKLLRDSRYEIAPFLETIFTSHDFTVMIRWPLTLNRRLS